MHLSPIIWHWERVNKSYTAASLISWFLTQPLKRGRETTCATPPPNRESRSESSPVLLLRKSRRAAANPGRTREREQCRVPCRSSTSGVATNWCWGLFVPHSTPSPWVVLSLSCEFELSYLPVPPYFSIGFILYFCIPGPYIQLLNLHHRLDISQHLKLITFCCSIQVSVILERHTGSSLVPNCSHLSQPNSCVVLSAPPPNVSNAFIVFCILCHPLIWPTIVWSLTQFIQIISPQPLLSLSKQCISGNNF